MSDEEFVAEIIISAPLPVRGVDHIEVGDAHCLPEEEKMRILEGQVQSGRVILGFNTRPESDGVTKVDHAAFVVGERGRG